MPQSTMRILDMDIDQSLFRHGVVAAFMQGMTTRNSAHGEPAATQHTEPFNGGVRIAGAARIETAARSEQRADAELVAAN